MARRPKRRYSRKKKRAIPRQIDAEVLPASLASNDLISVVLPTTVVSRSQAAYVKCTYTWDDIAANNQGPLEFGWAHSDYSDTEIEQALEATSSWDEGNLVVQEQAKRKVKRVGLIGETGSDVSVIYRDGMQAYTRLGWILTPGDTIRLWVRNVSSTSLSGSSKFGAHGFAGIRDA